MRSSCRFLSIVGLLLASWTGAAHATDAFNNGPICAGDTLKLGTSPVTGATYSWTGPNGFTSTERTPFIPNAQPIHSGSYCVRVTASGITAPPVCTDALVKPRPTVTASSNSPLCPGGTLQLSASSVAGGTYAWTGPNGFTSTLQNPSISNVSAIHAGQYCVVVTVDGCPSAPACTPVVISSPTTVASNGGPVCVGGTVQLSATTVAGGTYSWTGPGGFTSSLQNPTIPNAQLSQAGQYCVTVTVAGCTSPQSCTDVVVRAIPSVIASNGGPVCAGGTVQLSATPVAGATYAWTGPGGFTSTLQNPTIPNAQVSASGSYCVRVTVNGCPSPLSCTDVVVRAIPSVTASNGGPVCVGATVQLNATTVAGATYAWTGPGGFTSSLQNPTIPNAQVSASGSYCVTVTVSGCTSPQACTDVLVRPIPSVTASNGGPVCVGATVQLNATTVAGATYAWTGPGGFTSSLQNPTIPNAQLSQAGAYCVTVTVNGCPSPQSCTDVVVRAIPSVTASNGGPVCVGGTVQLNATTVAGATYAWTGPGGFTSSLQNPTIPGALVSASGSYCVTVTVNGCTSPQSCTDVLVRPLPSVTASNGGPVCVGATVQLNATTVAGATYAWTGPGGFTSSLQNPTIPNAQLSQAGAYCVTVTLDGCSSPQSCTDVVVRAIPSVVASNGGPVCVGATIQLNATTVAGATYAWTGPGGFTSSLQNPTIPGALVSQSGAYCVTATVDGCASPQSCTDVLVRPLPSVTASNGGPVCVGATVQLNATTVAGATYAWTGPGGFTSSLQNPTIPGAQVSQSGSYCVTVTVSGCTSPQSCTDVVVRPIPAVTASNGGPVCVGQTIQLSATTVPGGTYAWTGPGGFTSSLQNPTIPAATLAAAGQYCVVATVDGCESPGACTDVVVRPIPSVTASNGGPVCVGATVQLNATTVAGATYAWTGPGGFTSSLQNPTVPNAQLGQAGAYCVTVTVDGCASPQSCTDVVVRAIPTVTASNGGPVCAGGTVQLSASTVAGATYAWTGPGGFTSSLQNPTIPNAQVGQSGAYCVTVTLDGCASPASCTDVLVRALPAVVAANGGPVCVGATIQLSATTIPGATYAWTGPGGFTSTLQNPTVPGASLANAGQYCVVATLNGCESPGSCTDVVVNLIPSVTASNGGPVCVGATIQLNATTVPGATYAWTGPGGFTSSLQNPTIASATLASAGQYCVTATVAGCASPSSCTSVTVNAIPSVTASNSGPVCAGATVELTASLIAGATYAWNGPNGFTSTLRTPSLPNAQPSESGSYCVTVTVDGCTSPASCTIVLVRPTPGVTASNGGPVCVGATIQLNATTVAGATYAWTGPGGFTSSLQNPTIPSATPARAGSYCVTVTVDGCVSPASCTDVVVNEIPSVIASNGGPVCVGATVQLSATTVAGATYAWTGPGGFTSSLQNPTIPSATLADAGAYCVTATVAGCTSPPSCTDVVVRAIPSVVASNGGPVCVGATIQLNATTVAGATYAWTGPAGFTSSLQNPTVPSATLAQAGAYCVTVTVDGCASPASCTDVEVRAIPSVIAGNGGPVCVGATAQLTATTIAGATYAWTGPGGFTSTLQNPTIASATLADAGSYCVVATVSGCLSPASCTTVEVNAIPSVIAGNGGAVCTGQMVQLTATTVPGATYAWTGPGGFTSSLQNPTIPDAQPAQSGAYCVTATVGACTSPSSCTDVLVRPAPSTVATNGGPVCAGQTLALFASDVPGGSYLWSGPGGFSSTLQNPTIPDAQPSRSGSYCVVVTVAGCPSPASCTDAVVGPAPVATITADRTDVCGLQTATLCGPDAPGLDYLWSPGGQTSRCITTSTPGTYTLRVTDRASGCFATDDIVLRSGEEPKCSIEAKDKELCRGETTELCGPDADYDFLWSPGGQTTRCIEVSAPGIYTLTVTDPRTGCTATCTEEITDGGGETCEITATRTTICEGEVARLCGPESKDDDLVYRWSTGSDNRCIEVRSGGTYTLTVFSKKEEGDCGSTCEIVITEIPRPVCTITGPATLLSGQTGELCGPENPNYTYAWSNGATSRCITVGPGTYKLRVTDVTTGCRSEECSFTIRTMTCACETGYPDGSNPPASRVVFDEQDAFENVLPKDCGARDSLLRVWYEEDDAMLLGVRRVTIRTSSGSTSTDFPVTRNPEDPACVWMPQVGAPLVPGDLSGGDPYGRPIYPALFITDVTDNPASRAGDWQQGGVGIPPHKVCGVWKSAVRTLDLTVSPPRVRITPDANPSSNDGDLGAGADRPPGGFGTLDGRTAEVAWNLHQLPIVPGRVYRLYFMMYEGGSSPDAAQGCVTVHVPVIVTAGATRGLAAVQARRVGETDDDTPAVEMPDGGDGAEAAAEGATLPEVDGVFTGRFELRQNLPNPFEGSTTFRFTVPERSAVSLRIYTVQGQEVGTLLSENLEAGERSITWRAQDRFGRPLAPGVYVARLEARGAKETFSQVRKIVLSK